MGLSPSSAPISGNWMSSELACADSAVSIWGAPRVGTVGSRGPRPSIDPCPLESHPRCRRMRLVRALSSARPSLHCPCARPFFSAAQDAHRHLRPPDGGGAPRMVAEPLASSSGSDDGTSLPPAPPGHLALPTIPRPARTDGRHSAQSPLLPGGCQKGWEGGRGVGAWPGRLCGSPHFRGPRSSPMPTFPVSQTHMCTYLTLLRLRVHFARRHQEYFLSFFSQFSW